MAEIEEALVVGQRDDNDTRILLFVVLSKGRRFNDNLREKIRSHIPAAATPHHVPAEIIAIGEVPRTLNGKKVEMAVTRIIHDEPVTNRQALANPEALDQFVALPQLAKR